MPLSDVKIRQLKPPAQGQRSYPDGSIPGLALRISQGGARTFVLVHGRSRQRTTIGRYGIISLAQARQKAREILAEITLGTHKPKSLTFQDAFELYKANKLPQNRASTARETLRLLHKVRPTFGTALLADIATPDLAAFLDKTTEKAHVHTALATFFNWCVRRGYVENNPVARLQKLRQSPRDRALSPAELRSVLLTAATFGRYGQLITFLALTGQRLGQAHALTEAHIDRDKMTLSWPSFQMKTNRPHSIPYGCLTDNLLQSIVNSSQINCNLFTRTERVHARLVKAAGVPHFTRHDLRRSFATLHASLGTPQHIVERLLAHSTPGGSAIHLVYNRFQFQDELRAACLRYEQFLSSLMSGNGAGA